MCCYEYKSGLSLWRRGWTIDPLTYTLVALSLLINTFTTMKLSARAAGLFTRLNLKL